jgi:hypothetical protein
MPNDNRYLDDAKSHIGSSAAEISEGASAGQRFHALVLAAVGIEKLLKHIIARVNPALILKSQDFDSVVVHCHRESITAPDRLPELEKKASADVITLKASIQRASLFSNGVKDNAQFIHTLADFRDIALHRSSQELDITRVDRLLCRDFYNVVRDICADLSLSPQDFFGVHSSRIEAISAAITQQDNFQSNMEDLLKHYKQVWDKRSKNPTTIANAQKLTSVLLTKHSETTDCPCPACNNTAVATLEPDYDYDYDAEEGRTFGFVSGVYVTEIHCYYCSLRLDQYDQLKYVDADELLERGAE